MTLKTVTKTIHEVDSYALEEFVGTTLGVSGYSFVATEECGNDSVHDFKVTGEEDYRYNPEEIAEWIASDGNGWTSNGAILNHLCALGHIEPGTYLVSVCW